MDVKSQTYESSFFFASCVLRPKRDLLLSVARRPAVTLTWNAPSKAQGPGISVSRNEPSGVFVSRFCVSSSRFLGRCLLLGQRSRMNFLSHHIGPLFHQHRSNPSAELARHRHDGDPRTHMPRVPAANRAVKIPQLAILANRRPGGLDELTPQPAVPVRVIEPRSVFSPVEFSVGTTPKNPASLAHVFKLPPVADTSKEPARHDPADATNAHHVLHALRQFRIVLTQLSNLFGHLHNLLLRKLHVVQQLIDFEAHTLRALKFPQLALNFQRPAAPSRSRWESDPFEEQQRLNPLLHPRHFTHQGVAQLGEMAKLSINGRRHVNALQLSTAQALRQASAVEPIRFDSLPWTSRNHRRCRHQALIPLGRQPIIQSIPGRSSS